jgi:hypothetical protein
VVIRPEVDCSWCYLQGRLRVPAAPVLVSIEKVGGLYDLCDECQERVLGPFVKMQAARVVRANQTGDLPDGWLGNAWPNAVSTVPAVKPKAAPARPVAGTPPRKEIGGRRTPAKVKLPCPAAWCRHPGFVSTAGMGSHLAEVHGNVRVTDFVSRITECGLCTPPAPFDNPRKLGMHVGREHRHMLPAQATEGLGLLMIGILRRDDPHGVLKPMDEWAERFRPSGGQGPLLSQEVSGDAATSGAVGRGDGQ